MERPPSQMENVRPSGLRPPSSRLPTMKSALHETSQSDLNTKHTSSMRPPTVNGKHKITNLPEPEPKRKTLVERAGEAYGHRRTHSQYQKTPGTTLQHIVKSSGYGQRPASRQDVFIRPASAFANSRHITKPTNDHDDDMEEETITRRKGISTISSSPCNVSIRKKPNASSSSIARSQHLGSIFDNFVPSHNEEKDEIRCWSITTAMAGLFNEPSQEVYQEDVTSSKVSPSKLPVPVEFIPCPASDFPSSSLSSRFQLQRPPCEPRTLAYLTKESYTPINLTQSLTYHPEWDTQGRLEDIDKTLATFHESIIDSTETRKALEETVAVYKARVEELQETNRAIRQDYQTTNSDLDRARNDLQATILDLQQARSDHSKSQSETERRHDRDVHELKLQHEKQLQRLERTGEQAVAQLEKEVTEMKKSLETQKVDELTNLQAEHWEELDQLREKHITAMAALQQDLDNMRKSNEGLAAESTTQVLDLRQTITNLEGEIKKSHTASELLRSQLLAAEKKHTTLEQEKANLVSKAHFLEGNQEAQSQEFTNMTRRLQVAEAIAEAATDQLRREEILRRRLNAQILELKGNIRVFARVRPVLSHEDTPASVEYPDRDDLDGGKEMVVHAPTTFTATGKERNEKFPYAFDRVYAPEATNDKVFDDCRDLVQSVIDGYNVSILSYGQTGSGKTFGMSGVDGIIPSSIALLLSEIERLRTKGWEYQVQASFVEVYNESLNDLLGDAKTWDDEDQGTTSRTRSKARHEIHHDLSTGKTTVTNLTTTTLWPPNDVVRDNGAYIQQAASKLLDTATKNRRVAATKANERSSRSHSVFILTLHGHCEATNESSEGILNLVDLAGSERLKHSGAEGTRAKETAAINTSLKSLGDVIERIGSGGHVPYRNSKLTYLLQSSLGGTTANGKSSRTLFLLHLSPLQAHWQDTKTSLQFGVKVHNTHIGTAKRK